MRWKWPNSVQILPWTVDKAKTDEEKGQPEAGERQQQFAAAVQRLLALYTEHRMGTEQLADLFPLARIETAADLLASRGMTQEESRLRLAERRRLGHRRRLSVSLQTMRRLLMNSASSILLDLFRLLLLLSALLCLVLLLPSDPSNSLPMALLQLATLLLTLLGSTLARWRTGKWQHEHLMINSSNGGQQQWTDQQALFTVVRGDSKVTIRGRDILPGELVLLRAGQRAPADLRILKIVDAPLMADCGWLLPSADESVLQFTDRVAANTADLLSGRNILLAGSLCTEGNFLALAIRTGSQTLLSRLGSLQRHQMAKGTSKSAHLDRDYQLLVWLLLGISVTTALAAFLAALLFGPSADPLAIFVHVFLAQLVATLPQGLPLALDVQLFLIARRLRQKCGGLVLRTPEMAEQLGRSSMLMIHNPSVLFANGPVLSDLWLAGSNRKISAAELVEWAVKQRQNSDEMPKLLGQQFGQDAQEMLETLACCCKTSVAANVPSNGCTFWQSIRRSKRAKVTDSTGSSKQPTVCRLPHRELAHQQSFPMFTDPTDAALLKFRDQVKALNLIKTAGMELLHQECQPGSAATLLAAIRSRNAQNRLLARGEPEQVISCCSTVRTEQEDGRLIKVPLTDQHLVQFEEQFLQFSALGKRCLALAQLDVADDDQCSSSPTTVLSRSSSLSSSTMSSDNDWTDLLSSQAGGCWCFLGLFALSTRPKADLVAKLDALEADGIRTVFLSDEHPALVHSMAKSWGLERRGRPAMGKKEDIENGKRQKWPRIRSPFYKLRTRKHSIGSSSGYHSGELATDRRPSVASSFDDWPIDGESLAQMSVECLDKLLAAESGPLLFSRLSPEQIGHLTKRLQSRGQTITFVGQMGITDIASMEAADLTIVGHPSPAADAVSFLAQPTVDGLSSSDLDLTNLLAAIRTGRALRRNMASIVVFCLSQVPALVLPCLLTSLLGFPLGLSSFQVLSISLLAGIPCSVGLAFNRPSPTARAPAIRLPSLLIYGLLLAGPVLAVGCLLAFLTVFWQSGLGIVDLFDSADSYWLPNSPNMTTVIPADRQIGLSGQAAAGWHLTLVGAQQLHVWACAAQMEGQWTLAIFRNWVLWIAVAFNLACLLLLTVVQSLSAHIWIFPLGTSLALLVLNQLRKFACW